MLLLEFSLDRVVDGTVWDISGHGRSGACFDAATSPDPDGRFDHVVAFNGQSTRISIADVVCPPSFTLAAWVKKGPDLSFYYATIVAFGADTPFFGLKAGRPILGTTVISPEEIDAGWNHIAAVQDPSGSRIYVNGTLVASSSSRARTGGRGMDIGSNPGRRNAWFQGTMASVVLFDEALGEADLVQLMQRATAPASAPASAPVLEVECEVDAIVEQAAEPYERTAIELQWVFDYSLDIGGHEIVVHVAATSQTTFDGSNIEEKITFAIDLLGEPVLVSICHDNPVADVDELVLVFEEHALAEVHTKRSALRNKLGGAALQWLHDHLLEPKASIE